MTMMTNETSLIQVLTELGVDVHRGDGREISGKCPVHALRTGKEDNSPSWSMNATTGLWICFSCGARGSLTSLVSELSGKHDIVVEVHSMLIEAGLNTVQSDISIDTGHIEMPLSNEDIVKYAKYPRVPKSERQRRKLHEDDLERYGIRWDPDVDAWVIPILSPLGELKGWQLKGYNWVKNYPTGVKKANTLFGFTQLTSNSAVLVESPLDVVRFAGVFDRPQCVASFGAFVSSAQVRLLSTSVDRLVLALDNDTAGIKASKDLWERLPTFRRGLWFFHYGDSLLKDIGDLHSDAIESGLLLSSQLPPWSRDVATSRPRRSNTNRQFPRGMRTNGNRKSKAR